MNPAAAVTDEDEPFLPVGAAAALAGMHPQTLRQYDRLELVVPARTSGRGRRYSLRDVASLREVQQLSRDGVNLAGIKRILELERYNRELIGELTRLRAGRDSADRVFTADLTGVVVATRRGRRARRTGATVVVVR